LAIARLVPVSVGEVDGVTVDVGVGVGGEGVAGEVGGGGGLVVAVGVAGEEGGLVGVVGGSVSVLPAVVVLPAGVGRSGLP